MPSRTDRPSRARGSKSKWRIAAPLLLLPFVLPSAAITLVGVLGIGPAAPKGALAGQFDLVGDLVWASPTVLWAVGWLGAGQFPVRCRVVQNTAAC